MKFDFDFLSLEDLLPSYDPSEMYMKVFEILHYLPKHDYTEQSFQDCLLNNRGYFKEKLEPRCNEHQWLLEIGYELRKTLAYQYLPPDPKLNYDELPLLINRNNLLGDSISKIVAAEATSLARGVSVTFENEEGIGDGVLRDRIVSLATMMTDESQDAFLTSGDDIAQDGTRFYPKPGVVKEANFYICFGRLIALALIHEIQIGITLDRILFVQLANDDLILEDIAETSPYLYKSYNDILMCSPSKFHKMPLYLDDGDDVKVKFEEREQFVLQKIQAQLVDSIQTQTEHIIQGFDDIISSPNRTEFFQIIKLNDLDIMIRGLLDLCVED